MKDDQRTEKAEIAVLMTTALPKNVNNFAYIDGAWVTNYSSIVGLATALRLNLIQVAKMKLATEGKHSKMEVLYNYLSGSEFIQKVEAVFEAFKSMQEDLEQEKRAMKRIWSKREKQIERVIDNTAGMYGDMQGIIGASLPQLKSLELEALPAGTDFGEFKDDNEKDEIFEPEIPKEESIEDLDNDEKEEIFQSKIPKQESINEQIDTRFIKEKSSKKSEETLVEDLDEDELKILNCLREEFSGEAHIGDIALKLMMGPFLVTNRFNRLKSKGLVIEIKDTEGGIRYRINE